jgi:hypothetical protein
MELEDINLSVLLFEVQTNRNPEYLYYLDSFSVNWREELWLIGVKGKVIHTYNTNHFIWKADYESLKKWTDDFDDTSLRCWARDMKDLVNAKPVTNIKDIPAHRLPSLLPDPATLTRINLRLKDQGKPVGEQVNVQVDYQIPQILRYQAQMNAKLLERLLEMFGLKNCNCSESQKINEPVQL